MEAEKLREQKKALLLNSIERGTIQTCLQTNNYESTLKLLNSSVSNWESICEILEANFDDKFIVLGKFTEYTLFKMCLSEYDFIVEKLIKLLKTKRHLIFIYKENLIGNFSYLNQEESSNPILTFDNEYNRVYSNASKLEFWLNENDEEINEEAFLLKVRNLIKKLNNNIKILPFEKLIDIENAGQNFIENIVEGLLFRIYIPNERIYSNEFSKFIMLFRDYSSIVSNTELKIVQNKTDLGTICSLYKNGENISEIDVNVLYKDFSIFMDLCSSKPNEAEKLIDNLSISEPEKHKIFKKYVKESQRLLLDIKQEKEMKFLSIRHRLENELQEFELTNEVLEYVSNSFPNSNFLQKHGFGSQIVQNQTININPQIIHKVDGIVCRELNGNVNLNNEEQEIMKLIEKFSKNASENSDLQTSLYELKDTATTNDKKRSAWQKLSGFLVKAGDKVGEVGISLLTKYIEKQLGL